MEYRHIVHGFDPIFNAESRILILGSLPSVKSRENAFYYGHPQNRFWKVLGGVFEQDVPVTIAEKKEFLLHNHIALWDVIAECDIAGSSDASIKNLIPTDLSRILETAPIEAIFANGATAGKIYNQYQKKKTHRPVTVLPSTSPANAAWKLPRLTDAWKVIQV